MGFWNVIQETEFLEGMRVPSMAIVLEIFSCRMCFLPLFKNRFQQKVSEFSHVILSARRTSLSHSVPLMLLIIKKWPLGSVWLLKTEEITILLEIGTLFSQFRNFFSVKQNFMALSPPPSNFSLNQGCVRVMSSSKPARAWLRNARLFGSSVPV